MKKKTSGKLKKNEEKEKEKLEKINKIEIIKNSLKENPKKLIIIKETSEFDSSDWFEYLKIYSDYSLLVSFRLSNSIYSSLFFLTKQIFHNQLFFSLYKFHDLMSKFDFIFYIFMFINFIFIFYFLFFIFINLFLFLFLKYTF